MDLRDPVLREELAEEAYFKERGDDAAAEAEHDTDPDTQYWTMAWDDLSDHAKRPYRVAVAHTLDSLLKAGVV